MKKAILILLIPFLFVFISKAQLNYFRNKDTNGFSLHGGISHAKKMASAEIGISVNISSLVLGLDYSDLRIIVYDHYHDEERQVSLDLFTPYIEYGLIRTEKFATSFGIGYMQLSKMDVMFPVYASFLLDLSKKTNGFVLLPELTLGTAIASMGQSDKTFTSSLGLMAMFREEAGTSFFIYPVLSKNFQVTSPVFSLDIGFFFR